MLKKQTINSISRMPTITVPNNQLRVQLEHFTFTDLEGRTCIVFYTVITKDYMTVSHSVE